MTVVPIRILVADDHDMIRHGFRLILDSQPDMVVVAEAADGDSALRQARHLCPDVVLADIRMPGLDSQGGLELIRLLAGPDVAEPMRVIAVTTYDLDEYVQRALRNGACGFVLKRSGPTLLVEAIRAAMAGDALVSPQITMRLLRQLEPRPTRRGVPSEPLTTRERDVLALLADGRTNAEIAAHLSVSVATIKTHVASLGRKLHARNRVTIAAWAWDNGYRTT